MRNILSPLDGFSSPFGQRKNPLDRYAVAGSKPSLVYTPTFEASGGVPTSGLVTHSRSGTATYLDSAGTLQTAADGVLRDAAYAYVDGTLTGPYVLREPAATNLLHSTNALTTQDETVTAQPYTLHFTGTGTVTLSGASTAGPLVGTGTGENNRVSLTFTPSAGTLTLTVTGTVTNAQLETGSVPTSYIANTAGSGTATRNAETLTIASSKVPWPAGSNPDRALTIQMDGLMTYADQDINGRNDNQTGNAFWFLWRADASNSIGMQNFTASGTGNPLFDMFSSGVSDFVLAPTSVYSPGVNVPFNVAGRFGDTFVNGAADGTAFTANTTPTSLPDLSSTNIQIAFTDVIYIKQLRIWTTDLGDSGIATAST